MTSEQLADQITAAVNSLRGRILGTGKHQYDRGSVQVIETHSDKQLITDTIEELDDAVVYLLHLRSRLMVKLENL